MVEWAVYELYGSLTVLQRNFAALFNHRLRRWRFSATKQNSNWMLSNVLWSGGRSMLVHTLSLRRWHASIWLLQQQQCHANGYFLCPEIL